MGNPGFGRRLLAVVAVIGSLANPAYAGKLTGVLMSDAAVDRNLTNEGITDWAIWGFAANGTSTSLTPDVRKSDGAGISALTDISNGTPLRGLGQFGAFAHSFDWTDGTPTLSASGATGGLQHNTMPASNPVGEGFSLTVPADVVAQVVRVYVATHEGISTLTASLSDASAPNFVQNQGLMGAGNFPGVFEITYAADSPGQTLNVSFVLTQAAPMNDNNAQIHAVTLASTGASAPALNGWLLSIVALALLLSGAAVLRHTRQRRKVRAVGATCTI